MQISSNMVIYFSFEYPSWTKRKGHTVHTKTEAKKHTQRVTSNNQRLANAGENLFLSIW